jgi:hypothetical protein
MRSVLTPCSEIHFPNLPPPYLRDESHNLLYRVIHVCVVSLSFREIGEKVKSSW